MTRRASRVDPTATYSPTASAQELARQCFLSDFFLIHVPGQRLGVFFRGLAALEARVQRLDALGVRIAGTDVIQVMRQRRLGRQPDDGLGAVVYRQDVDTVRQLAAECLEQG